MPSDHYAIGFFLTFMYMYTDNGHWIIIVANRFGYHIVVNIELKLESHDEKFTTIQRISLKIYLIKTLSAVSGTLCRYILVILLTVPIVINVIDKQQIDIISIP